MSYHTKIIFGKDQVRKHHNNEAFSDYEKSINFKKYTFGTREERSAFYKGISEAMGRLEFEVINEFEDKINQQKEDENKFDYWVFIEKYYPKYYSCDSVLLSDILTRKLHGEEICEKDEEYIKDWNVRKELFELDKELLCEAFENYFDIVYPEEPQ
ncbi:hypothetical protein [Flavobacterium gawalongense]|uniref:Uncharacterized protein n=1 Tax=Flavobacterium gawalongense TaxID=2594432 RepID=A0A553BB35_9FLAO|nr:hypothetical protein [Flavobacterium gawalongense]TRX00629.1 hypothetical protein FNW33_11750 [Flavobacterium gawalongense]TRX01973.1 hypothetical protein FNW12_16610 [Flavobacterium gawalongense]TRX05450.1 hypothetical protein FNW11_16150 [Flavobacterium gawalongense]TRX06267.1 hypothetical protein FNW10_16185 [Flavobacterium gawalongense]TRX21948.1 hypothetical protein FNW38_16225 [Flavobacterium gawalongense]